MKNIHLTSKFCSITWLILLVPFLFITCKKSQIEEQQIPEISCEIIPYRKGDLWGIMHQSGDMIIAPQYDDVYLMSDGYAHIRMNNKEGLVSPKGELLVPPKYEYVTLFYEGRSAFRLGDGLQGYLDEGGKEVIPPIYEFTGEFVNNRAFVQSNGEYLLIDRDGNIVKKLQGLEPYYQDYFESMVGIKADANAILVTKSSNLQVGLLDSMGNFLLPAAYNSLSAPVMGVVIAEKDGYKGLIRINGTTVTPLEYEFLFRITDSLYSGQFKEKAGVIDLNGNTIIPFEYEYLFRDDLGNFVVGRDGKSGVINAQGTVKIPFNYLSLNYQKGYYLAYDDQMKTSLLDVDGNNIWKESYDNITVLGGDRFLVERNGKSGIVSKSEKVILPLEFDNNSSMEMGEDYFEFKNIDKTCLLLNQKHQAKIYSKDGKLLSDKNWQYLSSPNLFGLMIGTDANGRNSYIDMNGKIYAEDPPLQELTVNTSEEFIQAIGDDRKIVLKSGEYNLSKLKKGNKHVSIESFNNSPNIRIAGVKNLHIQAEGDVHIYIENEFHPVLSFENCYNISLSGARLGHQIEKGVCEGSVIYLENNVYCNIKNCDLYGSGTYGVESKFNSRVILEDCNIRECTYGILFLQNTYDAGFYQCDFFENGDMDLCHFSNCNHIVIQNCVFRENKSNNEWGPYFFFNTSGFHPQVEIIKCIFQDCSSTYISNYKGGVTFKDTDISSLQYQESFYQFME